MRRGCLYNARGGASTRCAGSPDRTGDLQLSGSPDEQARDRSTVEAAALLHGEIAAHHSCVGATRGEHLTRSGRKERSVRLRPLLDEAIGRLAQQLCARTSQRPPVALSRRNDETAARHAVRRRSSPPEARLHHDRGSDQRAQVEHAKERSRSACRIAERICRSVSAAATVSPAEADG